MRSVIAPRALALSASTSSEPHPSTNCSVDNPPLNRAQWTDTRYADLPGTATKFFKAKGDYTNAARARRI